MPPLEGAQNIRYFIDCIAHAMLIEAIPTSDGTRLLYAAQVGWSTMDTRSHHVTPRKRDRAPASHSNPDQTAP